MSSNITTSDFSFVFCPGSRAETTGAKYYAAIFQCWEEVWASAYKELKFQRALHSDLFTRQDYVGALFHRDICVGSVFFRWARSGDPDFRKDSYFKYWTDNSLQKLASRGDEIIVCSNFTLHSRARGQTLGLSGKDLLLGLVIEVFMNSEANAMTGAVRVDRGISELCERWGGSLLEVSVPCEFGENNTNHIGFFKDEIQKQKDIPDLKAMAQELWARRIVVGRDDRVMQYIHHHQGLRKVA